MAYLLSKAERQAKEDLGASGMLAEDHWREFLPRMVARLERKGRLYQALQAAEAAAIRQFNVLREQYLKAGEAPGMAALLAREQSGKDNLLLPPEKPESQK